MKPSDFRYNPFSDVSTAVLATERHLIPSVSPYVVALNEIPQKTSPSTMTVKQLNSDGGFGASFAEVAAIPEAGQFWADYNTNAAGSESWNTGKLLFNATDAGKMVEVTYTATGTLASVTSNMYPAWYRDRGDGSDGDFYPTANVTISGLKQYRSVFIADGVTVTVSKWAVLQCQGAFIVKGTLTASGQGAGGGMARGSANPAASGSSDQAFAGAGGAGAIGGSFDDVAGSGGTLTIGSMPKDIFYGRYLMQNMYIASGGGGGAGGGVEPGSGGNGGGCIYIVASEVVINGIVEANGNNGGTGKNSSGSGSGGGGGGGLIAVVAETISGSVNVKANGGIGGGGNNPAARGTDGFTFIKELGVM